MQWIPLGTGGYYPANGRHTMSFLLLGEGALLLDAGSGVARLAETPVREALSGYSQLEVLLTHYHLDHVSGLPVLPNVWNQPVRLWCPAAPLVECDGPQALVEMIAPPLFPRPLGQFPFPVELLPYTEGPLALGGWKVHVRAQRRHAGGSVGVKIDDTLAYVTDTESDPETARWVSGVDTLLHECWSTDEEAARDPQATSGHSCVSQVAEIANSAGVRRLVPVHHAPRRTAAEIEAMANALRERFRGEVLVAREGTAYS